MSILLVAALAGCVESQKKADPGPASDTTATFDSTRIDHTGTAPVEAPPDSAAMAHAWQAYMTPGEMHKLMANWNGKWDAEIRSSNAPGGPLTNSDKVSAEFRTIMNGLYQESKYKGTMMGMPFEGQGITGYDNARNKWFSTWIDNLGSGILYMEGDYDADNRTLTVSGKATNAGTGEQMDFKQVTRFTDDKNQTMEMYSGKGGQEMKVLEIVLKRK